MDDSLGAEKECGIATIGSRGFDFATLRDAEDYGRYFDHVARVFALLCSSYGTEISFELSLVRAHLSRMLETVRLLRLKYMHNPVGLRPLSIDLSSSGFPNGEEINALALDFKNRKEKLLDLPASVLLKRALVDHLILYQTDPRDVLANLSQRAYLDGLERGAAYLPFNPGPITCRGEDDEVRHYSFGWSCYDFVTNRPYIHVMTFDQDVDAESLEHRGGSFETFLATMRQEGSRAPNVGVLASAIDQSIEAIHPKILKRICVGPLYSRLLLDGRDVVSNDPIEPAVRELFRKSSRNTDDFILFVTDEVIFSKRQEITRSILSPRGKVREIFSIPESDPEAYERRASVVHNYALMQHQLLQHLSGEDLASIPTLKRAKKISFDEKGVIHGI